MKDIDANKAVELVDEALTFSPAQIAELQQERLRELVTYAKSNSPYLREKYRDLPKDFNLADIPVSTRPEMIENFDAWVTDPQVTQEKAAGYLSDHENITRLFLDKYRVITTSGTTSKPMTIVRDARHMAVHGALMDRRYFHGSLLKNVPNIDNKFPRTCAIIPDTGFHSSYTSYIRMRDAYDKNGLGDNLILLPINTPVSEMVRVLNGFQPEMLAGYPSVLAPLAYEQKAGRLNIHPGFIGCSAEKLDDTARIAMQEAFGCPVNDNYCSTEGGEIAMLCQNGKRHVNADWIIIEPVDKDKNLVPEGQASEGVLITNLANFVQPLIRYYVSDSVIMRSEPCKCGLPLPYVEMQGRAEEIFEFESRGSLARVSAPTIYIMLIDIPGCRTAQLVQTAKDALEILFEAFDGVNKDELSQKITAVVKNFLEANGIDGVKVTAVNSSPVRTKGGKVPIGRKTF